MIASCPKKRSPSRILLRIIAGVGLFALVPLALLIPTETAAQMDVTVELYTELLPFEKQEKLEDLKEKIEEYFCDYEWVEDFKGPPIPFTFRIYLVDESAGFEDRYGARIHASNDYDLQYLDKDCHFAYQPEERLEHDAVVYHSFTGLLDYYAYLIIGGEMDKQATLGGDPYLKKAQEVAQEALFSEYYRGWNRRYEELQSILGDENLAFRKMLAIYFRALAYWENEEAEKARSLCRSALTIIEEVLREQEGDRPISTEQEDRMARFFTHHYREIADLFAEDPQGQEVFELLISIDPQHEEFYQNFLKK